MTEKCSNYSIFKSLESSLDRLQEAKWFIHMMENHYHEADQFRWSLNSFLRTLKEVIQLVSIEVQNKPAIVAWFRVEKEKTGKDPLLHFLSKQRDIVVHKTMLKPASTGFIGFTRGRGLKLGMSAPIDPLEDSQVAILKYTHYAASHSDFMGILYTEEDGGCEYTCVQREWRLAEYPDQELTMLAATAWEQVAQLTLGVAQQLGASVVKPKVELGDPNIIQFEIYKPIWIKKQLELAKEHIAQSRE